MGKSFSSIQIHVMVYGHKGSRSHFYVSQQLTSRFGKGKAI